MSADGVLTVTTPSGITPHHPTTRHATTTGSP
jgi:hypothetical protein